MYCNTWVATNSGVNTYQTNTGIQGAQMCYGLDSQNDFDIVCNTLSTTVKGGLTIYTQYNPTVGVTSPAPLLSVYPSGIQFRNTGITFDKGTLTHAASDTGFYFQTGRDTQTSPSIGNATATSQAVIFTTAFKSGTVPVVMVTGITTTGNTVANALIYTVADSISNTGFTYWVKNTSQSATGSLQWGITYIAVGQY
jgi:hypothetical protein